jgi:hypothetical protein
MQFSKDGIGTFSLRSGSDKGSNFNHLHDDCEYKNIFLLSKVAHAMISNVSAHVPVTLLFIRCAYTFFVLNKNGAKAVG